MTSSSPLALVTGGQQGIGLGIARALDAAGFRLALVALAPPEDDSVKQALSVLVSGTTYIQQDLAEVAAFPAMIEGIQSRQGPITTLISNAGVPARIRGDMLDMLPENFDFTLNINLRGSFFLAQTVARRMIAQDGPSPYRSIIFVTSVSAAMVSVERAEYCISKSGAAMMAQLYAARLAPHGIGVYDIRPGIIATPMTAGVRDTYSARIADGLVPAKRWGEPEDIGRVALSLAKGDFAFSTGMVVPVDGGLSIQRL